MKRLCSILLAALFLFSTGQKASAQLFTAGAGYSGIFETKTGGTGPSNSYTNGFTAGAEWHFGFYRHVGYIVGAHYLFATARGFDDANPAVVETYRQHALLIPASVNYTFLELGYDNQIFVFAGPTAEIGLSSHLYADNSDPVNLYTASTGGQNRLNLWAGGGIGLDIHRNVLLKVSYNYSLFNNARGADSGVHSIGRHILSIGVQFTFARNGYWAEARR